MWGRCKSSLFWLVVVLFEWVLLFIFTLKFLLLRVFLEWSFRMFVIFVGMLIVVESKLFFEAGLIDCLFFVWGVFFCFNVCKNFLKHQSRCASGEMVFIFLVNRAAPVKNVAPATTILRTKSSKAREVIQAKRPKTRKRHICRIENLPTGVSNICSCKKPVSSNQSVCINSDK